MLSFSFKAVFTNLHPICSKILMEKTLVFNSLNYKHRFTSDRYPCKCVTENSFIFHFKGAIVLKGLFIDGPLFQKVSIFSKNSLSLFSVRTFHVTLYVSDKSSILAPKQCDRIGWQTVNQSERKTVLTWAVVVAQLAEWLLLIQEIGSSNPVIRKLYILPTVLKRRRK